MQRQPAVITVAGVIVVASWSLLAAGQLAQAPVRTSGQTITPVYEGWYQNPDGTFSLSWGYFNRNSEEIIEIPIGADNRVDVTYLEEAEYEAELQRRKALTDNDE